MKPKNLQRYEREYRWIDDDAYQRLINYIKNHNLRKSDITLLQKEIKRISKISWNYLKIILDILPEPTPRPRFTSFGHFYVKNAHTNNTFVKHMVQSDKDLYHYITTPCHFIVKNYFPIPKAFSRVNTILAELGCIEMIGRPDWDNLGKTYSDMIQKWILSDDALIIHGESYKYYSLKPRVEILIEYKESHSCKRNKQLVEQSTFFQQRKV